VIRLIQLSPFPHTKRSDGPFPALRATYRPGGPLSIATLPGSWQDWHDGQSPTFKPLVPRAKPISPAPETH